jgi:hypothetical protein
MRYPMTWCLAVAALSLASSNVQAATWALGRTDSQVCRDRAGNQRSINYCHNCAQAVGAGAYVSWTFVANCDGKATNRRARGEVSCAGAYGSETQQKNAIRAQATGQLPGAGTACPRE